MIRFFVGRLEVRLHWSFLLLLGLAALPGSLLPLLGLGAAACHELGHLAAMALAGGLPARLRLSFFGGRLQSSGCLGWLAELFCLGAGAGVNLVLAGCFGAVQGYGAQLFSAINLVLGLFNLLPVQGLDGGRMLGVAVGQRLPLRQGRAVLAAISLATLAGLWGWCAWLAVRNPHLPMLAAVPLVPAVAFFNWLKD